jgi:hypothetical protein
MYGSKTYFERLLSTVQKGCIALKPSKSGLILLKKGCEFGMGIEIYSEF